MPICSLRNEVLRNQHSVTKWICGSLWNNRSKTPANVKQFCCCF